MSKLYWLKGLLSQLCFWQPKTINFNQCPWCSFDFDCELEVRWHDSGNYFDGEMTRYWVEGIATCPRCHHRFGYQDSD